MAEQQLYWISKKSTYGAGKDALNYGDEVGNKIPVDRIPHHKKTGEVGALEMASAANVNTDAAYDAIKEKLEEYDMVIKETIELLKQDSIKKDEKTSMVEMLEGLSDET